MPRVQRLFSALVRKPPGQEPPWPDHHQDDREHQPDQRKRLIEGKRFGTGYGTGIPAPLARLPLPPNIDRTRTDLG